MAAYRYISLAAFMFVILAIPSVQGATVFVESFNNISVGILPPRNNWVNEFDGEDIFIDTVSYEGSRGVYSRNDTSARYVYRNVPHLEDYVNGTLSYWMMIDDTIGAGAIQFFGGEGATPLYMVRYNSDYGIAGYFDAGYSGNISTAAKGQWVNVEISWQNDTEYMVCVNETACLSGLNYGGNVGNLTRLRIAHNVNLVGTFTSQYVDNIIVYDIFNYSAPAPTEITLLSPGNDTYNTNRIDLNVSNTTNIEHWHYRIGNETTNHTFTPNSTVLLGLNHIGQQNITIFGNNSVTGAWYSDTVWFTLSYITIEEDFVPAPVYETDQPLAWFNLDILNFSAVTSVDVDFIFNNSVGNVTIGFANNYTTNFNVPNINNENSVVVYWNYTVTYADATTSSHNGTVRTILVKIISLSSCGSGGNVTLEIRGFNESNSSLLPIVFNLGLSADIGLNSKHFNFSLTGANVYYICISPGDEEYTGDIDLEYHTTGYPKRYYYMRNANLTNNSADINLYLLPDSAALDDTDFIVRDSNYKEQPNIVVQAQRYFPGLGSYLTVAMGLTGPNGKTSMFLTEDVYYKWLLQREGITLSLTSPEPLTESPVIQYIDVESRAAFFQYIDDIAYRCRDDTASQNIICEYSAPATNLDIMTLSMSRKLLYNRTSPFCTETSVQPADTLICNYGSYENDTVFWELEGQFSGSGTEWLVLSNGFIQPVSFLWGSSLGVSGIIIAIGMFLLFMGAGLTSPRIAIIMTTVSIPVSWLAGLHAISISTILGLVAAAGLIVYRMRD